MTTDNIDSTMTGRVAWHVGLVSAPSFRKVSARFTNIKYELGYQNVSRRYSNKSFTAI